MKKLDKLDTLFSEYVRRRAIAETGGCQRCLTAKYDTTKVDGTIYPAYMLLQCAHFYGRAKKSTRYDPDNAFGLCGACHIYFTSHPAEFVQWFIEKKGSMVYDLLQVRTRTPARYLDRAAIEIYLTDQIRGLQQG